MSENLEYGLNASAKEFDGEHKYIRITDIDDSRHEFIQSSVTSPDIDFIKADNYKLKKNDLLFARTGASVGKTYRYLESDGLVYYAGFLIRARIKSEFSSEFVFQNTFTSSYKKFIMVTSQRSGQPGVNAEEYSNFKITLPYYEEQEKIGSFFKQFDNLTALHQCKLDALKQLKKGFLQLMFPKKGEVVPELRFAHFQETWEPRKLGEITDSYSGGTPSVNNKSFYNGKIPFIRSAEINSDSTELTLTKEGLESSSAKLVEKGDILYALYGATSGEVGISKISGAINQAILAIKPKNGNNPYVISQWLRKEKEQIIGTYLQGGQGNLSGNIVRNLVIALPSEKQEQERIGSFFEQLDHLTTLHQNKLDRLNNLKKAYLQNLFI